jgi:PhnB protein
MSQTKVKPIPQGHHTVTPYIVVNDGKAAIEFYKKAFGAEALGVADGPNSKIMHAALRIGDSIIFLSDEFPEMDGSKSPKTLGNSTGSLWLYVENCDAAFKRAVDAGATARMQPADMFWGDRFGQAVDPFGHTWSFATRIKDMTPEEMKKAQRDFEAQQTSPMRSS